MMEVCFIGRDLSFLSWSNFFFFPSHFFLAKIKVLYANADLIWPWGTVTISRPWQCELNLWPLPPIGLISTVMDSLTFDPSKGLLESLTLLNTDRHGDDFIISLCMFVCVVHVWPWPTNLTVLPSVSLWAVAGVARSLRKALPSVQTWVCHAGLHLS